MLCGLGERQSLENLVQMLGRATFNGKDILERNIGKGGKEQILINWTDWDAAHAYYEFQRQIFERLRNGTSLQKILSEPDADKFTAMANIACRGKRTIGPTKLKNVNRISEKIFEPPDDGAALRRGYEWALRYGLPFLNTTTGETMKINSPLSEDDHKAISASADLKVIEEYLYHTKYHKVFQAMIVRKAMSIWFNGYEASEQGEAKEEVFFTKTYCKNLCGELHIVGSAKGSLTVKSVSKDWSDHSACHLPLGSEDKGRWKLEPCDWPIFRRRPIEERDGTAGENFGYELNEELRKFGRRFRAQLKAQPPIFQQDDLRRYVASVPVAVVETGGGGGGGGGTGRGKKRRIPKPPPPQVLEESVGGAGEEGGALYNDTAEAGRKKRRTMAKKDPNAPKGPPNAFGELVTPISVEGTLAQAPISFF